MIEDGTAKDGVVIGPVELTTPTTTHVQAPRSPWECPRCKKVNAPHVDQCRCDSLSSIQRFNTKGRVSP